MPARSVAVVVWSALLILLATGCPPAGPAGNGTTPKPMPAEVDPNEVWVGMIEAYARAKSYSDEGLVRLRYKQAGRQDEDSGPLSVCFQRPGKLRLKAYQLDLASDDGKTTARITDQQSNHLDNQVVARPEPELTRAALLADPVIHDVVAGGLGGFPVPLDLLLVNTPLGDLITKDTTMQWIGDDPVDERICHKVQVSTVDGPFVFWIDSESRVLRRLDYPTQRLREQMTAGGGDVKEVNLSAVFHNAQLNPEVGDETFEIEVPEDAKRVRAFVLPPQPLPSPLLGVRPPYYSFSDLQGKRVTRDQMNGKVTVLAWFNDHPACKETLTQLQQVSSKYADRADKLQFFGVCIEPGDRSNEQIGKLAAGWKVEFPTVRDLDAFGRDVFRIPWAPTMVVLDAEGKVQLFQVGANPELARHLPEVLDRLIAGEDLAGQLVARYRQEVAAYEQALASGGADQPKVVEVPKTKIKPAAPPAKLAFQTKWTVELIRSPGNVLVVYSDDPPRVLVMDSGHSVAEIDYDGNLVKTRKLKLPDKMTVSYLRSAVDGSGKRYYLASALRAPQVYGFDANWQPLFRYPPADQPHDGIHDVQLFDLNADGKPEVYVGFWGLVGVHQLTLAGKRVWTNRRANHVLSLAGSLPNSIRWRKLLATGDGGPLLRINQFGNHDPPITVKDRGIHHIFFANNVATTAPYVGLSYQSDGRMLALGLSGEFREQWSYQLPAGTFRSEIQFVTSGQLRDDKHTEWVFAGPDGTIHIVGEDGEFYDTFAVGEPLRGIGMLRWKDLRGLVIATPTRVQCLAFESK